MSDALTRRFALSDLRAARESGTKVPMLTCYDYTSAKFMQEAGIPMLLVGDSAANVILGHDTTLPISLPLLIELTAAVRRGAPLAFVVGDMPFGAYATIETGCENVVQMVKQTGCDCVKLEVSEGHAELIRRLADAGVAVMAHVGLKPQSVGLLGGYRFQGRTAVEARRVVDLAVRMQDAGAAALLIEAVPNAVSEAVIARTRIPVIGCGAGPACHGHVVVTHDTLGLTARPPRFAPQLADLATPLRQALELYRRQVTEGQYPAAEHLYEMPVAERREFEGQQAG